jgi:hypothetical protein
VSQNREFWSVDVIIATVGKQPMPILIPILQLAPVTVQLIVTDEVQEVARHIRDALRLEPKAAVVRAYSHEPVNPFIVRETYERCKAILSSQRFAGKQFAINITGGTTPMELGAYKAAREFGVPMFYVDTDDQVIIHFSPEGEETSREDITVQVSAEVYLTAHGATVSPKPEWGTAVANDAVWLKPYRQMARTLGEAGTRSEQLLDAIRLAYNKDDKLGSVSNAHDETRTLARRMAKHDMLADVHDDGENLHFRVVDEVLKREFLAGHWLELYVHDVCVRSGEFDDVQISVNIKRPVKPQTVENEVDVIVTRRGRLAVISCKTGGEMSVERERRKKEAARTAIYELDSLLQAELMGLYAQKLLVSNRAKLPLALVSRAHLSQTTCVTGHQLVDVVRIVREHLE